MNNSTDISLDAPSSHRVNLEAIPEDLRQLDQWVNWRELKRGAKLTKAPYQPCGQPAKANDPHTWSSFDDVCAAYMADPNTYAGIGYVLSEDDPYCGVDLDACLSPGTRRVTHWAKDVLDAVKSYAEVSPSGCGLKIIGRGRIPFPAGASGKTNRGVAAHPAAGGKEAEIAGYNDRRYFALTGNVYGGRREIRGCQPGLDQLYEQYWAGVTSGTTGLSPAASRELAGTAGVHAGALSAMVRATKTITDHADGSRRLMTCACRCVELDLSDAEAIVTINAYAAERPFPRPWSPEEILTRLRDAEKRCARGGKIVIRNFESVEVAGADGKTKTIIIPRSMSEVIADIKLHTGDWPRRVDNALFVDDPAHGINWFDRRGAAGVFGYLRAKHNVDWHGGGNFVGQFELFAELERTATNYDAVELLPHEPPMPRVYYSGVAPAPGDGTHLQRLLDRFLPESPLDRHLLQASLMTLFWGGAPGARPVFAFLSRTGRGGGKTAAATSIARVAGGTIDVSLGEDADKLLTRLLSPNARTKRAVLLDNLKSRRLSWDTLEALVTAPIISGRQLYVGEGRRPNTLTWFITLNGPSMATDMAQRTVFVRLARAQYDGAWREQTDGYIDQHGDQIIGDIIAALRGPQQPLASCSRWATWEAAVLSRLPVPDAVQRVILERQAEVNSDIEEAELVETFIAAQLTRLGYHSDSAVVRIPSRCAAEWYALATGEKPIVTSCAKKLHQMAEEGQLQRLAPEPGRRHGRCFLWTGACADTAQCVADDLAERLARGR